MGFFRKATRTAGRVAKNVAKEKILGESLDGDKKSKSKKAEKERERKEYEEYQRLKEKFEPKDDATMRAEWKVYYEESCEGDCETCPYYDWCPDDIDELEDAEPQDEEAADEEVEEEPEPELTEEEKAAKEAAEAFYEAGCDGECETCEHYDWCPAEEEGNPDDKVIIAGVTQGEMKEMAKGSVELAREGALAAKELKEAMDDIMGGLDIKRYLQ